LYEEPFFNEKQRSRSHFGEATNSKAALAPSDEPLRRSPAKHPLKIKVLIPSHLTFVQIIF
jgi:hypothetical protein